MRMWGVGVCCPQRSVGLDSRRHQVAVKSIGSNPNCTRYQLCLGFLIYIAES